MKRSGPEHPKMRALARALGVPHYAAVGLLELLWHFAAKFAPQGDVGRFDNEALAEALGYDGAPDALVDALVAARWLDVCPTNRLLVHGWEEHADQGVRNTLKGRGLAFLSPTPVEPKSNPRRTRVRPQSDQGRQGLGSGTGLGSGSGKALALSESDEFAAFYAAYPRHEARDDAEKAWRQTATIRPPHAVLLAAVDAQAKHNFAGREKRHVPLPATWLRGGRWKDDIVPFEPPRSGKVTTMDAARNVAAQWIAEGKIAL
jgi:hypothetical protein